MKNGTETRMLTWSCKVTLVALSSLHYKLCAPVQFVFMDNENYEETRLKRDDAWAKYMKEGTEASLLFWNGKVISVDPPTMMELEVTDTDPGLKGNTVSGQHPSKGPHHARQRTVMSIYQSTVYCVLQHSLGSQGLYVYSKVCLWQGR